MSLRIALTLTLLALASTAPARSACDFTAVYFFGASNLDTGNFLNHPYWSTQPFAPVPENGYWMGRWQSGPVWADPFAGALGLLALASSDGGTNYAFGAAGTSPHPGEVPDPPGSPNHALYLSTQIDEALADAGGVLDPEAIYVFEIGHNDVAIFGRTEEEAPTAGGVVITQMGRLRDAGAQVYLVRLLGPGLEPYATPFNQAVLAGVDTLRAGGAVVYVVDHANFAAHFLTAGYLSTLGITQFGPGVNCRANAACQAAASTAALAGEVYDHAFLFFDGVGPHWNHAVHAEIARHALALVPCSGAAMFADGFESDTTLAWSSTVPSI